MRSLTILFSLLFLINASAAERTKTLAQLKKDLTTEKNETQRFYILEEIVTKFASVPLPANTREEAKKSAETLLEMTTKFIDDWNYGNAVHHAYLVLGRLEVIKGNLDEAKRFLKLSAQSGSPQLDAFGPNMTLAKELIDRGERPAVVEYFEDCLKFWDSKIAKSKIEEWKADMARGKTPSFGGNLVY